MKIDEKNQIMEVLNVYFIVDKNGKKHIRWEFKDSTNTFHLLGVLEKIKFELLKKTKGVRYDDL